GIVGMFNWSLHAGATLEEARTYALNTLVAMEVFYLFNVRFLGSGSLASWQRLFGTRVIWLALVVVTGMQMLLTYAPFMNRLFDTRPVNIFYGIEIIAIGVSLFILLEVEKWIRHRWLERR